MLHLVEKYMRNYGAKQPTCAGPDVDSLVNLVGAQLSAAVYTLQYAIPMETIKITSVSDNFSQITGCDAKEFKNYQQFYKNIVTESHDFFSFLRGIHQKTGSLCERKYVVRAESGGRNVLLDCTYSRKISDEVVEYTGVITNITSTEIYNLALTISEERLRVALAASGAGFFDWEHGVSEIFCDDTTVDLLGTRSPKVTLMGCLRMIDRSQLREHLSAIREVFDNKCDSFSRDVQIYLPNEHWVCVSGRVIERDAKSGRPLRIAGTVRDITEVKNIALEREHMNIVLEQRVRERTERLKAELATKIAAEKQLIENLERERELNTTKSIFVNMVSHEFRTPLAIIQSAVDLMQMYFDKLTKEDIDSTLLSIKQSVRRMTKTMSDVLILGKVQTSQLKFNPSMVDVLYLCSSVIDDLESTSYPRRVLFEIGEHVPERLCVDGGLIEHIVLNLLSNALKYSDDRVILHVGYRDHSLIIRVEDNGIGIPKQDAESIFKLFHRGSNVSNRPGIGVGMFIVKYCVNLHHGKISFHTQTGKGTSFVVILPAGVEEGKGRG